MNSLDKNSNKTLRNKAYSGFLSSSLAQQLLWVETAIFHQGLKPETLASVSVMGVAASPLPSQHLLYYLLSPACWFTCTELMLLAYPVHCFHNVTTVFGATGKCPVWDYPLWEAE